MNRLEQLKQMTTVVADTGDIDSIAAYTPTDATTNPSLLYKAAQQSQYKPLLDDAIGYAKEHSNILEQQALYMMDKLAVNFGVKILDIIPGRVSTEVDARLSFDTEASIRRAEHIIALYKEQDIDPERVLIKVASTWEGIKAAEQLERQGIHCNLTLMFSLTQAAACAEAGVTLISPFVGRILDWYKKAEGVEGYAPADDPGVKSVTNIYNYYKRHGYPTVVMGASFRNTDEIVQLAGCDYLTISPSLMEELRSSDAELARQLDPVAAQQLEIPQLELNEAGFRWHLNEDAMATEKLAEGIRNFTKDTLKLEEFACRACTSH